MLVPVSLLVFLFVSFVFPVFVSLSLNSCVMFWDIRAPRVLQTMADQRKQKVEEKPLENPHGVPNTFKHLDLTWKPLIRVQHISYNISYCIYHTVPLLMYNRPLG